MDEKYRGCIIDEDEAKRKHIYKPYQLVFDPTPKQKHHKELIATIPPIGHELDCPIEFEQFPYAKYEWLRIMELDKAHEIITPAKRELFYGYCLMVEYRKRCMLEWDGNEDYKQWIDRKKNKIYVKTEYFTNQIDRLNKDIYLVGRKLGLFDITEVSNGRIKYTADDDDETEIDEGNEGYYVAPNDDTRYVAPDDDSDLFD